MGWFKKKITQVDIEAEKEKMFYEKLLFARYLLVGTGESQAFWKQVKKNSKT